MVKTFDLLLKLITSLTSPGSAGGDGANAHVSMVIDIIEACIVREKYRSMEVVRIDAEIEKNLVKENWRDGRVAPCSAAVPELQESDIDDSSRIVAQMGLEPWLKAMNEHPNFDIIIGGRSYDPAPYAAFCVWKGFPDLGIAYHMGKIMECGALCAKPKSKEALAVVRQGSFDIRPLAPGARCTKISVSAHTLYEKSRPDILLGPGGALHLGTATYEELPDRRTVRVRGAKFIPETQYTIKLEGARVRGYRTAFIGGFRDPILISQIDDFFAQGKKYLHEMIKYPFDLDIHIYGKNGIMKSLEPDRNTSPKELCIVGEIRAETQEQASQVSSLVRIWCMHGSYSHQVATAGNFAMPFSPFDIPLGLYSEFCIYHIMRVSDPTALFPVSTLKIQGANTATRPEALSARSKEDPTSDDRAQHGHTAGNGQIEDPTPFTLSPPPGPGFMHLASLASVIRSKNAGPYELTFDVMFPDEQTYNQVKQSNVLTAETVSRLYSIPVDEVYVSLWWEPALAYKATIRRPTVSASLGEADTHGSAQHVPLMYLQIPHCLLKGA